MHAIYILLTNSCVSQQKSSGKYEGVKKYLTIKSTAKNPLHDWHGIPVIYLYIYSSVHSKTLFWLVTFNIWRTCLYWPPNNDSQSIIKVSGLKKRVITGERKFHPKYFLNPTTKSKHFWLSLKYVNFYCTIHWYWINAMRESLVDEIL